MNLLAQTTQTVQAGQDWTTGDLLILAVPLTIAAFALLVFSFGYLMRWSD